MGGRNCTARAGREQAVGRCSDEGAVVGRYILRLLGHRGTFERGSSRLFLGQKREIIAS